jgi:sugar lactone lactonase YvrE
VVTRWLVGLVVLAIVAHLLFAPIPVRPVSWQAPSPPGYVGRHAPNTRLANLEHVSLGDEEAPEFVRLGPDGRLYASVVSGALLRTRPDRESFEPWMNTGGRVLGFDFDASGRLIAADSKRGLLAIGQDGQVAVIADSADGGPIRFANSLVVARSGRVYFTDASQRFGPEQSVGTLEASILDIMEHSATGRLIELDPSSGQTRAVMRDLSYANGVALSADESHLFVVETGSYRVWKVPVSARNVSAKAPAADARVLLDNLPGYPDNLLCGEDGRIWLGFAKPRSRLVDWMADKPFLRAVTLRLPRSMWPVPPAYGHVIAFAEDGTVVADLQDPTGAYPETTGVTETADRLYIQSLHAKSLGWLPKPASWDGGAP